MRQEPEHESLEPGEGGPLGANDGAAPPGDGARRGGAQCNGAPSNDVQPGGGIPWAGGRPPRPDQARGSSRPKAGQILVGGMPPGRGRRHILLTLNSLPASLSLSRHDSRPAECQQLLHEAWAAQRPHTAGTLPH